MKKTSPGFSLVEVLIALVLLQIALLALAPLFIYAARSNSSGGDIGSVGALAVKRMEDLRSTTFGNLTAGGSLTSNVTGYVDTSSPGFVVRWLVTDNATPATTKTVKVRAVSQRQVLGLAKEITLVSLRSE